MKKAFTLIELLIVVAIIAILAAIAVPNFLEAQVRAKVSRCRNDLRTIATGIESYIVDSGVVMGLDDWNNKLALGDANLARKVAFSKLTSPIAYLTSVPRDPFYSGDERVGGRPDGPYEFRTSNIFSTGVWKFPRMRGYTWALNSIGPSRRTGDGFIGMGTVVRGTTALAKTFIYDATNGTVSQGFILRTNKGEYVVDNSPAV